MLNTTIIKNKTLTYVAIAGLSSLIASCAGQITSPQQPFTPVSYQNLPGWQGALTPHQKAYMKTVCARVETQKSLSVALYGGLEKWKNACVAWEFCEKQGKNKCFQNTYMPVELQAAKPLFTGYYAPIFKGSAVKTKTFNTALYGTPKDLISASLEQFNPDLKGVKLVGRVQGQNFIPYADRAEIDAKGLKADPIVWMSEEDAFFMHIQGSGSIELANGHVIHVAYGGNNGLDYHAIGRTLVHKGHLKKEDVSMDNIRAWLEKAPSYQKKAVLNSNPRYIFFRKGDGKVRGSLNIELEDHLSLAVDPSYVPLGAPLWVSTVETESQKPLKQLMFATDTGGAINGAVRGDIYFGKGDAAGAKAGVQNAEGRLFVFIPR